MDDQQQSIERYQRLDGLGALPNAGSNAHEHDDLERDLEAADCREWFDGVRRFDERIRQAMDNVEIPAGLESRLLSQFSAPGVATADTVTETAVGSPALAPESPPQNKRWRRRAFSAAFAATVAACLFVAFRVFFPSALPELSPGTVRDLAISYYETELDQQEPTDPSDAFPLSSSVLQTPTDPWQCRQIQGFLSENGVGRTGVAYETRFSGIQDARAVLFVVKFRGKPTEDWVGRTVAPMRAALGTTGVLSLAVWQEQDPNNPDLHLLYVLVVDGGIRGKEYADSELYPLLVPQRPIT